MAAAHSHNKGGLCGYMAIWLWLLLQGRGQGSVGGKVAKWCGTKCGAEWIAASM